MKNLGSAAEANAQTMKLSRESFQDIACNTNLHKTLKYCLTEQVPKQKTQTPFIFTAQKVNNVTVVWFEHK